MICGRRFEHEDGMAAIPVEIAISWNVSPARHGVFSENGLPPLAYHWDQ